MILSVRLHIPLLAACVLGSPAPGVSQPEYVRQDAGTAGLASCFPPRVAGLDIRDSAGFFTGEELFDLINGGAEVFFEYGFARAGSAHYDRDSSGTIAVDVYEMADTLAAFGLYSFMAALTGTAAPVGQEAVAGTDFLIFWKGKHVVTIAALDSPVQQDVAALAAAVDTAIAGNGSVPDVVVRLRRPETLCHDVVYVKGVLGLFRHATFDPSGFLPPAGGAVALTESCWVMVAPCTSPPRCARLFEAARDSAADLPWVHDRAFDGLHSTGGWRRDKCVLFTRMGRFLVLVEGPDGDQTRRAAGRLVGAFSGP